MGRRTIEFDGGNLQNSDVGISRKTSLDHNMANVARTRKKCHLNFFDLLETNDLDLWMIEYENKV